MRQLTYHKRDLGCVSVTGGVMGMSEQRRIWVVMDNVKLLDMTKDEALWLAGELLEESGREQEHE